MSNHDDETRDAAAQAQLLYVAYYGRPGDPGGLEFWTNEFMNSDHTDSAVAAFGASAEFAMLSEGMDHAMLVNLLYMQMFNRAPDDAGRDFYVGQLESGEATLASIALDIANGAQGDDMTTLHNKIAVANTFSEAVRGADAEYGMSHIPHAQAVLAAVDATDASVMSGNTAAEGLVAQMDGGMTYMLTAGRDIIESGVDNDTYTATTATVSDADVIEDASTTDHDALNITNTGGGEDPDNAGQFLDGVKAITVRNVEYINIDQDLFEGLEGPINLSGVMGAKVTISSEKLGYDGVVTVSGVGDNTIILGDNVKTLTANNVNGAAFDLGTAAMATINRVTYADPVTAGTSLAPGSPVLCINGDITLVVDNGTQNVAAKASPFTIKGTADATVKLTSSGQTSDSPAAPVPFAVTGDGDMILEIVSLAGTPNSIGGASITNTKESGTLTVQTAATADAGNIAGITGDTTVLFTSPDITGITAGDGQHILFPAAPTGGVTVTGTAAMGAPVSATAPTVTNVTVTANKGLTAGITFTAVKSATLNLAEQALGAASTVSALTSNGVGGTGVGGPVSVISTGAVTVGALSAANADFSGVEGDLIIGSIAVSSEVIGGSGKNTVQSPTGDFALGYTGGAGVDTLIAGASPTVAAATADTRIGADLGAGNDVLVLGTAVASAAAGATIAVDGGAGLDTVVVHGTGTVTNLSTMTGLTLKGFEVLAVTGAADTIADNPDTTIDERTNSPTDSPAGGAEALTATVSVEQLAHFSVVTTADQAGQKYGPADSLAVTVVSGAKNVDLSGLTLTDRVSFVLNGNRNADNTADLAATAQKALTLIGSSGNDTINGGQFDGDTLTGGGGADTFVFEANDSYTPATYNPTGDPTGALVTPVVVDTITDYTRAVDRIDLDAAAIATAVTTATDFTGNALAILGGAGTTVGYTVVNGVLTLGGLSADRARVDRLDEWVVLAEEANQGGVIAFQFNGDTYIHEEAGGTTVNLIKLAGVTGVDALEFLATPTTEPTVPGVDVLIL